MKMKIAAMLAAALLAGRAWGQTDTWTAGAGSSDWTNALNWSAGVPIAVPVVIPATVYDPVISSAVSGISALTVQSGATLTIAAGGTLDLYYGGPSSIDAGGTLSLSGTALLRISPSKTLNVSGTLVAAPSGGNSPTITKIPSNLVDPLLVDPSAPIDVNITGLADISGLNFSYGDAQGLNFNEATIRNLNGVTFSNVTTRAMTITESALTLYCRAMVFNGPMTYSVYAVDTNAGDDVRITIETLGGGGSGAGHAYTFDDDADGDGFSSSGGAVVNWVYAIGTPSGYPQGAIDLSTYAWYATYTYVKNDRGRSYVMRCDGSGNVTYAYSFDESIYGALEGAPWWNNDAGSRWITFGTSGGFLFRLDDTGSALSISPGWPLDLSTLTPPCVEVTSPVITDGSRVYFGGRETASTHRMYALAESSTAPTAWSWSPNPILVSAVHTQPGFSGVDATTLYAASDVTSGAAHAYAISAATGVVNADNSTSKAHDMRAPVTAVVGGAGRLIAVGDSGGRLQVMDASSGALPNVAGFPYLCSPHALGDVQIGAGVLVDAWSGASYFGDSDGHIYVVTGAGADYVPAAVPAFPRQFEAGVAINSAPAFWGGLLYIGNDNGKIFVIDRSNDVATPFKTLASGPGVVVGDISWVDPTGTGAWTIIVSASNGRTYAIAPSADPTAPE